MLSPVSILRFLPALRPEALAWGLLSSVVAAPVAAGYQVDSGPGPQSAEGPRQPSVLLPESVPRPTLDGILDDEAWGLAIPFPELIQTLPVKGAAPSQRTEIKVVHDRERLYIALACFDTEPEGIRATQRERDANLDPDDRVEILLDTFDDNRNGFWFQIGPAGSLGDALVARNASSFNKDWDGLWDGRARITDEGWFAELEIPFATLEFADDTRQFGFNVRRFVRRNTEELRLSAPDPALRFFDPAFAGTLTGLESLDRGIGLTLSPFLTATYARDDATGDRDRLGDGGLDLFWRLTPKVKLSLSANTDFAETEVDSRQVNLTRFSLFFPEQRAFFLEDSSAFVFGNGGGGGDVVPFFSRRIGLSGSGQPVGIDLASKLVARDERGSLGLLGALTEETAEVGDAGLFVARPSLALFGRSDAGLLITEGDPDGEGSARTFGADFNLRTQSLFGDRNGRFSGYWVGTERDEDSGNAFLAELAYPNDQVQLEATYLEVSENFDPALGFVRRRGVRRYDGSISLSPRINTDIRTLDFDLSGTWVTDREDNTQSERLFWVPMGIQWESNDRFRPFVRHEREVITEPFTIADQATIPEGDYQYLRYGARIDTSDRRPVDVELEVEGGQFYDGHRTDFEVELNWRPGALLDLSLELEHRELALAGEEFDINVAALGAQLNFNPRISWNNLFQYDDVSRDLGWNSRVRWILEPGNELFFVINQSWLAGAGDFVPGDGQAIAKLVFTFRF